MILVDHQAGASPLIVETWMGTGNKLYPSTETGKQTLVDAINAHLLP